MRDKNHERAAAEDTCWDLIGAGIYVDANATLEIAMPLFETGQNFIPVVSLSSDASPPELLGAVFYVDALKVYNRALAATAAEEHS